MLKTAGLGLTLALLAATVLAAAPEHRIGQKGLAFTASELTIRVGEQVRFVNDDPFFHNVFSVSSAKPFDLGMFPKGGSKAVTFDQTGEVKVECAIHPFMSMNIQVVD